MIEQKPPGWDKDDITSFLEQAQKNSYATFHRLRDLFRRLIDINKIFLKAIDYMGNSKEWFAFLFFLKTHSAFLAAIRLAIATEIPEAYMVLRGTLENSLYGWYLHKNKSLTDVWLKRHDSEASMKEVKKKFHVRAILDLLKKNHNRLGRMANVLYERCIDFGAHPNERSLSASLKITEEQKGIKFDLTYLTDSTVAIKLCLKTCAQIGVLCLKILQSIMPERFAITGLDSELDKVLKGL